MLSQFAKRWVGVVVALSAALMMAGAPSARAAEPGRLKSIFDFDDDAPGTVSKATPTTTKPAAEPTEPKPDNPTPPTKPAESTEVPRTPGTLTFKPPTAVPPTTTVRPPTVQPREVTPIPTEQPRVLLPVPDPKAQEKALREIKEIFKTEYRAVGAERVAVAVKLMQAGSAEMSDPGARFVLLREARDMASSAGDPRVGLAAARQLAAGFAVDLNDMGVAVLTTASRAATTPDRAGEVAEVAMTLITRAAQAQEFDLALRILGIAEGSARVMRSAPLTAKLQALAKDFRSRKANADRLAAARATLEKKPADPEACAVVGRQLCLEDGNWVDGLPLLAKGSDAPLKNLALRDATSPTDTGAQAELGNGWWAAAQFQPLTARLRMQERAAFWYDRALPALSGARHDQAAIRIAAARSGAAEVLLMEVPIAADPAKARQGRDALAKGEPFAKDVIKESVTIPAGKPQLLSGTVTTPEKGDRVDITFEPGAEIRGGKIMLSRIGHLKIRGTPEKPVIFRNVEMGMDLSGSVEAEYAVFDNCTFRKSGAWFAYFSTHWTFKNSVLYKCKFARLDGTDYGFRIESCRLIGMTFPEITHKRDPAKDYNHLDRLRHDWNRIRGCEFADCTVPPTVAWCAEDSNFIGCKFVPGEAFEGAEAFEWRAFVGDTVGDGPQAVFDAKPPTRAKVKYVPAEKATVVPRIGEKLIPEITYGTRAVARND